MRRLAGLLLVIPALSARAQILDRDAMLRRQLRDNRDVAWFAERIPMFESPDSAIDATYYYRWELVTKHLTYGAPETGYTFTEFIDRPFWSGAYGAISCPLGHQMDEIRWLNDRRIIDDFARYWFDAPGAQPRSYSNWYGAAVWGTYEVLGDTSFLRGMLPYMKRQYAGWLAERWDPAHGMFKWDGLHDGMERSITSRQTDDIDEGAVGYRPTLNSYLYADAMAIARASALFRDTSVAREFRDRADTLRARVERELWDPRREFFLHQFANDEKDGVKALSRTYDTGKYAGDPHGREEIGYVPWQFDLPEQGKGYERAWRFLMDTAYFLAPYGPTTAERHDPQFYVSPTCCWWSGNSWPYATSQTLTAMANLLNDYRQDVVTARDWMTVFDIYTRTQRKDGRPYIAEAANPDDGSWKGHDTPYHSEHYFHSSYVDLVITGVVGLRPRADDSIEVNPLAPPTWPWFALDGVRYHGHRVSVIWDRDGTRYNRGKGLLIVDDTVVIAHAPTLERTVAHLGALRLEKRVPALVNVAVNNGRGAYPFIETSFAAPENPPTYLNDGNYWYHREPPNRWTTVGSKHGADTVTIWFGAPRSVERVTLYPVSDDYAFRREDGTAVLETSEIIVPADAPKRVDLEMWTGTRWVSVPSQRRVPAAPEARRANVVSFPRIRTSRLRLVLLPQNGAAIGLSEIEAWGPPQDVSAPSAPPRDLAFGATASASFTSTYDHVEQVNDMRVAFTKYSRNRWTAYGSPNASDWVEIDLKAPQVVHTLELYLFGDGRGVQAPRHYRVQVWNGAWHDAHEVSRWPAVPLASARNEVHITATRTSRVRVIFDHALPAVSGLTELIVR